MMNSMVMSMNMVEDNLFDAVGLSRLIPAANATTLQDIRNSTHLRKSLSTTKQLNCNLLIPNETTNHTNFSSIKIHIETNCRVYNFRELQYVWKLGFCLSMV
jgi:hypothetical protein